MKHLVPVVFKFAIVCGLATSVNGAIGIYNSSEACLLGSGKTNDFKIDCSKTSTLGLISVRRVLHGVTPLAMKCIGFAPASSCCPGYNKSRDCLFPTDEGAAPLRRNCDGSDACYPNLQQAKVGDACPPRDSGSLNYSTTYSYFAFVEYSCIGTESLVDVCASTLNITATELYLETNIYHTNTEHFNKTCSCVVSTQCGHNLIFHAYDLGLSKDAKGQCHETVVFSDRRNDTISANLTCSDNGAGVKMREVGVGEVEGSVFVSESNTVDFGLQLLGINNGKMLIRATASRGAPVEVRCGEGRDQTSPQNRDCLTITTKSTTTTAVTDTTKVVATAQTSTVPGMSSTTKVSGTKTLKGFNTSQTCLTGRDSSLYVEIDCSKTPNLGHIFVSRIFQGTPPNSTHRCGITSPASDCCPRYDKSRDCLIATEEGLEKLKKHCDGLEQCSVRLERGAVEKECPAREGGSVTYPQYSSFAVVEYTCINTGLLFDVCTIGNTKRGAELYLETNVYNVNTGHANKTCPCTISTQCGRRLVFHIYDLDLVKDTQGQCKETVVLADYSNSSISTNFSCSDNGVGEGHLTVGVGEMEGSVFISQSNVANFQLQLLGSNEGTVLIRVTATEGALVEVRCGSTAEQDVWKEHQCPTTPLLQITTPAPLITTPPDYESSTTLESGGGKGEPNTQDSAVIAGISLAAVIVCLVILILALLIWRSRRHREEEPITESGFMHERGNLPATPVTPVPVDPHVYDSIRTTMMNGDLNKQTLHESLQENYTSIVLATARDGPAAMYSPTYERLIVNVDSGHPQGAVGGFENPVYFPNNDLNQFKEEEDKMNGNM